jgi:glucan 1,3-beta-glucosidase
MTPTLFEGVVGADETSLCVELGEVARDRLLHHRSTFITEPDFEWLARIGIGAVRIPVGHWIFGAPYPYHETYGAAEHPYVEGGIGSLDSAFEWADRHGLRVILDLHAAPGGQNGFDNSGIAGVIDWPNKPEYIEHSLATLERLAARYADRSCLHAIEVLNEPHHDIPTSVLRAYTEEAYLRIRSHCAKEDVAVVFHDGFRSFHEYDGFMSEPEFGNVILDIHRYQCFERDDIDTDIHGHIQKAAIEWKNEADDIIGHSGRWTYAGEWSLGLDPAFATLWTQGESDRPHTPMDTFQKDVAYRAYAAAQLATFEKYLGWFFWSYKTEARPAWSFRDCVERGWLPGDFHS